MINFRREKILKEHITWSVTDDITQCRIQKGQAMDSSGDKTMPLVNSFVEEMLKSFRTSSFYQ